MSEESTNSSPETTKQESSASAAPAQVTGNASPSAGVEVNTSSGNEKSEEKQQGSARDGRQGGRDGRRGQGPRQRRDRQERDKGDDLTEKVVFINRCAKVVKGGRRFSFSALVVVGDLKGKVGVGFGKANEVADSIRKAGADARRNLVEITTDGSTIPHEVIGEHGGGRVLLRPASEGTGVIAGGGTRAVLEVSGITDVLAKNMGSNNHANAVKATISALASLRNREQIYSARGLKIAEKAAL